MAIRVLSWICRIFLAAVFLYSGYVKIDQPLQFAATLSAYKLFPEPMIMPMMNYFPWVEITLALLLLAGWKLRWIAAATIALLSMFIGIMGITYARGIQADCGCFGPGDRISPLTLARDAFFLIPAVFLVLEPWVRARCKPTVPFAKLDRSVARD